MPDNDDLDPRAIVAKLAEEERRLAKGTFLAPVVAGGRVCVRVQGIVYELAVRQHFEGWAILKMTAPGKAVVASTPSKTLIANYLRIFPRVRMVLLDRFHDRWYALSASTSDTRVQLSGPVPVHLVEGAQRFQTVNTRFDGSHFWFESIDRRRDPVVAATLNKALSNKLRPDDLKCSGAVPQERLAYKIIWLHEYGDEPEQETEVNRIGNALNHAGASLESFWSPSAGETTVRFSVDGTTHTVTVRSSDLTTISAGVCLSGQDGDFDLTSIVSVLREALAQHYDDVL